MRFIVTDDIFDCGFAIFNSLNSYRSHNYEEKHTHVFKKHYGSHPAVLARIWYDLCEWILEESDQTEKGLRNFLIACHFLWAYPKNAQILADSFGVCLCSLQGDRLWRWIRMIGELRQYKVIWPAAEYNNPDGRIFLVTIDGVDCKTRERKHPTMPIDTGTFSHKFNHGGLKYEIAIDIFTGQVVWISGPFPGGVHDKTIYSQNLQHMIPAGKKVIVDRVYGSRAQPDDHEKLSLPNACDPPELKNFKARARARHESFNGRLKFFRCLSDPFRHAHDQHVHAFGAVAVTIIYQMQMGSPLFEV